MTSSVVGLWGNGLPWPTGASSVSGMAMTTMLTVRLRGRLTPAVGVARPSTRLG